MDATVIVSVLTAALTKVADPLVQDAYQGLKKLLLAKFGDPVLQMTLEQHTQDPKTWTAPLQKSIAETGAADDHEVVTAATTLRDRLGGDEAVARQVVTVLGNNNNVITIDRVTGGTITGTTTDGNTKRDDS